MKHPRLRVSYSTRRVRLKVRGSVKTDGSKGTKRGVTKLSDKGKDRVPCKTKRS